MGIERSATADEPARGPRLQVAEPERPATTPDGIPLADEARARWGTVHLAYPATDVFLRSGARLDSPVWGTVLEVRQVDSYDPSIDNPATRGGRSGSILGFDGVRYDLAHFDTIVDDLAVGDEVASGQNSAPWATQAGRRPATSTSRSRRRVRAGSDPRAGA